MSEVRSQRNGRALADVDEYVAALGDHVDRFRDVLRAQPPLVSGIVARSPLARSILTAWLGRRYELVVVDWGTPGHGLPVWSPLLTGRRRLVYLNFHTPAPGMTLRAAPLRYMRFALVQRPALRAAVRCVQTLSLADEALYRKTLRLAGDRVVCVPYAWRIQRETDHARRPQGGRRVLASGRAHTDWSTFFAAARGAEWDVTVVCGRADLETVRTFNVDGRARVLCEIPHDEHTELLRLADVCVIPLREDRISAGHVRVRDANEYGIPIVAARIESLREYIVDGDTGLLYEPGDAARLREAVDRVLEDPSLSARLTATAIARSRSWDHADHFAGQRALVERLLGVSHVEERRLEPAQVTALRP